MNFTTISNAMKVTGLSYLGSINSNAKMVKNKKVSNNYTYFLNLSPANTSGYNVCPYSTKECRLGCLATSGRAKVEIWTGKNVIRNARIKKTKLFFEQNEFFMRWLIADIKAKQRKAKKDGYNFSVRLNGTSDIEWENHKIDGLNIFEHFPEVQFYDYTKNYNRMYSTSAIKNYQLTYSYNGNNENKCIDLLQNKKNVAIVFNIKDAKELPAEWNGFEVINGDLTDYRPSDGHGVVVGLKWKDMPDKSINERVKNSKFVLQVVEPTAV
ncbi:MAG: hypothetical protein R6U15_01760 [Candidatus Izemoplasmatales bacterium]